MKKLTILLTLLFAGSLAFAQIPTIHNPNAKVTITKEQIDAWKDKAPKAPTDITTLTFEGLGNGEIIGNYYNGGAGTNYGVSFSDNALALIDGAHGGSGDFMNEPSPVTVLFFETGSPVMNVAAGFTTGFSFYYSSFGTITVYVYDGLDGTGTLLASETFPANYHTGCTGIPYNFCNWDAVGVAFDGTAKSILFTGATSACAFDDVTFGSVTPHPTAVPTVSEWGLIILGLALLAFGTLYIIRRKSFVRMG